MNPEAMPKCPQCGKLLPSDAPDGLCPKCVMAMNLKTETVFTGDSPAAQPPLPPEQIAPHFPHLEILECLGRGGMGVVYKARQKTLNRFVALKLLAPERVHDAKFAERFTREAQALAALNHPNIVTIYDFGQAGGFYFLLMEFVDGANLRQLLRARKFTPEEALAIVPPLCDALQFAHERGIVHRDIKPENLLLDKTGRVKVADFGIAKMLGTDNDGKGSESAAPENATQHAVGTPGYSAPEQKSNPQCVDSRADIYSLGVVFYEMLTGELPGKKIEAPSKKVQIDVRLDEVVLRALEKTPELRWQTAADLRTRVETIARTENPETQNRKADVEARFCLAAIVGVCWAGLAAVAAIWFGILNGERVGVWREMSTPGKLGFVLTELLGMAGWSATLGTTILGWIAVSQIRRSAGKLYGLGLAVFDGLFFPLLVLGFLVFTVVANIVPQSVGSEFTIIILVAVILGLGWLDFLIIRRVWRAVNLPLDGQPNIPPAKDSSGKTLAGFALFFAGLSGVLGAVAFCLWPNPLAALVLSIPAAALMGIIFGIPSRAHRLGKQAIAIGSVNLAIWLAIGIAVQFFKPAAAAPQNPSFGPVVERVITAGNDAHSFYSFDRGDYVSGPTDFDPADEKNNYKLWKWMGENHVDVFARTRDGRPVLVRSEMVATDLNEDDFDRLSLAGLDENSTWTGLLNAQMRPQETSTINRGKLRGNKDTLVFQNRYEVTGLLQVVAVTSNPPGVKIRYKLVQSGQAKPAAAQNLSFGPVIEVFLPDILERGGHEALDLQSGKLLSLPRLTFKSDHASLHRDDLLFLAWLQTNKVDFIVARESEQSDKLYLMCIKTKLSVFAGEFTSATPSECLVALQSGKILQAMDERDVDVAYNKAGIRLYGLPPPIRTLAFKTREGRQGLLEFMGYTENPRGVKIRYKLAQPEPPKSTASSNLSFGPVVEQTVNSAIDFDTGNLFEMPEKFSDDFDENAAAVVAWMQQHGVDADWEGKKFLCFGMRSVALRYTDWETLSPMELARKIESPETNALSQATMKPQFVDEGAGEVMVATITGGHGDGDENKPQPTRQPSDKDVLTWGFKTREGGMGTLQITGFDDHTRSVKIRYKLMQSAKGKIDTASSLAPNAKDFGPVIERLINDELATNSLLDLDSGKFVTIEAVKLPTSLKDASEQEAESFVRAGADVAALPPEVSDVSGLMGFNLVAMPVGPEAWDNASAQLVKDDVSSFNSGSIAPISGMGKLPATYVFKTREGGMGLLQIMCFTRKPSGVNIRYKLVQSEQPKSAAAQNSSFGPVEERVIEPTNPNRRALNLAFGNFISPGPGRKLDFSEAGKNTLRAAGVDLFAPQISSGGFVGVLVTLDMRLCAQCSPLEPGDKAVALDDLTAEQLELLLVQLENWRENMEKVSIPGLDFRNATTQITKGGLYVFVTRNYVKGVLQITDDSRGVKIRYKLVQPPSQAGTLTTSPVEDSWRTALTLEGPRFEVTQSDEPLRNISLTTAISVKSVAWEGSFGVGTGDPATQVEIHLPEDIRWKWYWQMRIFDRAGREYFHDQISPPVTGTNGYIDVNYVAEIFKVATGDVEKILLQCRPLP